jgi:hypothetical protein
MNSTKIKTYKILIDSKLFANMRGSSPAEVAKKAASKILRKLLNRTHFSIQENRKIRHYDAKRENLVRPYSKNGKLITYRIIVKKMGKQVGGIYPPILDDPTDPIFTFFPKKEYYEIQYISRVSQYIKYRILSNSEWCIDFYVEIEEKTLELDNLNKCHNKSGLINLNKIIEYGNYLKKNDIIDKIKLLDTSTIYHNNKRLKYIPLWLLSILCYGHSWYNKFGFLSDDNIKEYESNSKLIIMNFKEFIDYCIEKYLLNKKNYYNHLENKIQDLKLLPQNHITIKEINKMLQNKNNKNSLSNKKLIEKIKIEIHEILARIQNIIEKFQHQIVKDVFSTIKEQLKNPELSEEELDEIIELFKFIESSKTIIYDPILIKILE